MCIGLPMRVVETGRGWAWCEGMGQRRQINTMLVGDQPVGTWLLTFLDAARQVLSADEAARVSAAVQAVNRVMLGDTDVDRLFADLVDREPPRPASLPPRRLVGLQEEC